MSENAVSVLQSIALLFVVGIAVYGCNYRIDSDSRFELEKLKLRAPEISVKK